MNPKDKARRGKQMRPDQIAMPPQMAQERALQKARSAQFEAAHFQLVTNLNSVLTVDAVKSSVSQEIDHDRIAMISIQAVDAAFKVLGVTVSDRDDEDDKPKIEV